MALTQEEIDALPDGTLVMVSIDGDKPQPYPLKPHMRKSLRVLCNEVDDVLVTLAPPTAEELCAALTEMYALTDDVRPGCCVSLENYMQCRERAADLIQRMASP